MEQRSRWIFENLYLECTAGTPPTSTRVMTMTSAPFRVAGNKLALLGYVINSSGLAGSDPLTVEILGAIVPNGTKPIVVDTPAITAGGPMQFDITSAGSDSGSVNAWYSPIVQVRVTLSAPTSGTARMILSIGLAESSQ